MTGRELCLIRVDLRLKRADFSRMLGFRGNSHTEFNRIWKLERKPDVGPDIERRVHAYLLAESRARYKRTLAEREGLR